MLNGRLYLESPEKTAELGWVYSFITPTSLYANTTELNSCNRHKDECKPSLAVSPPQIN